MVQRKVPPKLLGIQADQANNKLDKTRFGRILGPSSPKHQDGLTKKMKKSRSITKRSDPESSSKNPKFRNEVSLPGKPPPLPPPSSEKAVEATPEKQFPTRRSESSPNYMKSTSSSDARKERSQVSPQTITTPKKSSYSSGSSHKLAKSLTKTTSLKLGRTLTKSPSFKPARSSSSTKKKSPQVVLYDDIDVQRATCSSTLKESKFPSYLQLSHGATESEGTSAMKVCPYTYCSLNGHRHTQHPPLKSFVSARRRMLKTQKSTRLGCLSPGRARAGDDGKKEAQVKQINLDDKPVIEETDRPLIPDSFLIQIYVKGEKGGVEETSSSITNLAEELEFGDRVGQDIAEGISFKQEEIAEENLCNHSDHFEEEFTAETEEDGSEHEKCDMEWEEGQFSAQSPDGDGANLETDSCSCDYDYDLDLGKFSFGFDDISSCKFDEITSHEGPQEISEDEGRAGSESYSYIQIWGREEDYAEGRSDGEATDERSELDDYEGTSITLAPTQVEDAQKYETEVLGAENKCPIQIGEGVALMEKEDCELANGDSTEKQNDGRDEDDYTPGDNSEVYQFEADGEASVAESPLDKIDDLENKQALLAIAADDDAMKNEQDEAVELLNGVTEAELHMTLVADNCYLTDETEENSMDKNCSGDAIVEDQDESRLNHVILSQDKTHDDKDEMEVDYAAMSEPEGSSPSAENAVRRSKIPFVRGERKPDQEQPNASINLRITKGIRSEEELEDLRKFNPREPNYLPVKPDPGAEKVDLKHQMMDERKDSQEWMVDYVLRQTVNKLATARKRKVALLVEAFEKVTPVPKYQQSHLRHTPSAFAHTRIVQACS